LSFPGTVLINSCSARSLRTCCLLLTTPAMAAAFAARDGRAQRKRERLVVERARISTCVCQLAANAQREMRESRSSLRQGYQGYAKGRSYAFLNQIKDRRLRAWAKGAKPIGGQSRSSATAARWIWDGKDMRARNDVGG
jgi:hypothetical protein